MSYFTAVRIYSLIELCILAALVVAAIAGASQAELVLGWTHGFGWIALGRSVVPYKLLFLWHSDTAYLEKAC